MKKGSTRVKEINIKILLISTIFGAAAALIILLAVSAMISRETIPTGYEKIYIAVCLVVAGVVGTWISASYMNCKKIFAAIWNTVSSEALFLLAAAFLKEKAFDFHQMPFQVLCIGLGGITGSILSAKGTRRK